MLSRLFQRRTIWYPTRPGWMVLSAVFGMPTVLWCFFGENFLSHTERLPAEVLIVEGWIGFEGVRAAKAEFEQGGYSYIVTAGALTDGRWGPERWNYATEARALLLREGLPADKVIAAPALETVNQRTFESAAAVCRNLRFKNLHPSTVNVFTVGAHARRSRLVYAKVLPPETRVGVVSWTSVENRPGPWWNSSERAADLIKETAGWLFEALLNSGRTSNSFVRREP